LMTPEWSMRISPHVSAAYASRTLIFRRPRGKVEPARSIFKVPSYEFPVLLLPPVCFSPFLSRHARIRVVSKPLGHPSALSCAFAYRALLSVYVRACVHARARVCVCSFHLRIYVHKGVSCVYDLARYLFLGGIRSFS